MRVSLVLLLAALSSQAAARETVPWLSLSVVEEARAPRARLHLDLQTAEGYSCLGYTIAAQAQRRGPVIDVRVGDVKPQVGPCLTAVGPAKGQVTLAPLPPGSYSLRLRHEGGVDEYRLLLAADRLTVTPVRTRFSNLSGPAVSRRLPSGAATVRCTSSCAGASPGACDRFFSDPALAELAALPHSDLPYAVSWFNEEGRVYGPPAADTLRALLRERYHDACLTIVVRTSDGQVFYNVDPTPPTPSPQ